ncbi:MAG TPA: amidohydrolase family protein, partial [Dehalococcoidia bacterium]|nr:amidohydrolase family protein [Dehalococcoidia bacterium]
MKIDIHSHVIPPETIGKAGKYGPEVVRGEGLTEVRVGEYRTTIWRNPKSPRFESAPTPEARIEGMDREGIDVMGCTISPLFYLYWAETEIGIDWSRLNNDALARYCSAFPERLFFLATLPLQDIEAGVREAERAVKQLGAKGINLGTHDIAGRNLDDEAFWPLYEKVQAYDIPIFVHPYPLGIYDPPGADKYNLSWAAGYIHGETLAVATLMLGGVFDEFPGLKVIVSHGGGSVPFQFGRLEYIAETMRDVRAKKPLREYLKNFYFDVLVHDAKARQYLV